MSGGGRTTQGVLRAVPLLLVGGVAAVFGLLSPRFFTPENLVNVLVQTSSLAILATGTTYVLLTGGIDLSVGSIMALAAVAVAKLVLGGTPLAVAVAASLMVGVACGSLNAWLVVRLRLAPFIVTLATLYVERGLALYVTQTRAMNLPDTVLRLGAGRVIGVPVPIWAMALTLAAAQLVLSRTQFGRQLYATGHNHEAARRAGVRTERVLAGVYLVSGLCAAFAGVISVAQLGAVSPTFGVQREFAAVAAAVLGGTSLFGGRGSVVPGALVGALLVQVVENGLVIINANPYLYPMVTAGTILLAVTMDGLRQRHIERQGRRKIRPLEATA